MHTHGGHQPRIMYLYSRYSIVYNDLSPCAMNRLRVGGKSELRLDQRGLFVRFLNR